MTRMLCSLFRDRTSIHPLCQAVIKDEATALQS